MDDLYFVSQSACGKFHISVKLKPSRQLIFERETVFAYDIKGAVIYFAK